MNPLRMLIATILVFTVLGCRDTNPKQQPQQQATKIAEPKHNPYVVYIEKVRSGEMTAEEAEAAYVDDTGGQAGDLAFQLWKEGLLK